jgi:hypothetical protein
MYTTKYMKNQPKQKIKKFSEGGYVDARDIQTDEDEINYQAAAGRTRDYVPQVMRDHEIEAAPPDRRMDRYSVERAIDKTMATSRRKAADSSLQKDTRTRVRGGKD